MSECGNSLGGLEAGTVLFLTQASSCRVVVRIKVGCAPRYVTPNPNMAVKGMLFQ